MEIEQTPVLTRKQIRQAQKQAKLPKRTRIKLMEAKCRKLKTRNRNRIAKISKKRNRRS